MLGGSSGQIRGNVLGPAVLTKGLAQYANIEPSDTALIVLGAPRHEVEDTLSVMSYQQVVISHNRMPGTFRRPLSK